MLKKNMVKLKYLLGKHKVNRSTGGNFAIFIILCFFGIFQIIPMVFALSSAFKPLNELLLFPPKIMVQNPTLNNFRDLFMLMTNSWVPFSRYLFNSIFITLIGTVLCIFIATLAAYPLAKHNMPGKRLINWLVVTALMLSQDVSGTTQFLIMHKLNIIDSYFSIIIPYLATSFGVFLTKQFLEQTIHNSLLESARIDGASEFRIWWSIVLPIMKPAIYTLMIFSIKDLWNNPGTVIYSEKLKTLPYAMQQMVAGGIIRTGAASAIGVIMLIVPVVSFIISQSKVVETMSTSGIK